MEIKPLYNSWRNITAMHIELSNRCNAGCPMCPRYIGAGKELNPLLNLTEVSLDQFKEWFPPSFVRQLIRVYACGNYGDPIAAKDTLEIFKYLRETGSKNLALVMHTNGSARSESWWKEMGKIMSGEHGRDDGMTFSVDGLWDTNHLYRRNTNFDKIYANMKSFTSAGGIAKWDFIAFDFNEHQIDEAKAIAKDLGFSTFNIKRTTRWMNYDENGQGFYKVQNPDGTSYYIRQPTESRLKHQNDVVFTKAVKNLIPQYITNDEFQRLMPENTEEFIVNTDLDSGEQIKIKHNKLGIACRAKVGQFQKNNEIFLSATGHVFPCCFLGGEPWRYGSQFWNPNDNSLKMIELNGGMDSIDLHHHTLEEIINTPYYQRYLPLSFERESNMRSFQCSSCCGLEYNKLDQGELGNNRYHVNEVK